MFAEVRDVTGRLSNAWQQLMLPRGQPAEIAPSPMPQNRRKIASAHCTLTLVVAPPCDSIFLLQLARPPFVAFVAVAPPAIGHACDAMHRQRTSPPMICVSGFSALSFRLAFTEKRTKAKMAFKSLPPPPPHYGRIRSVCILYQHYLLSLDLRDVDLCPDQPRYVRIRSSEVSVVPC